MPQRWLEKDERQYQHIRKSLQEKGTPEDKAEEIAARTVNKQRNKEGRTPNKKSMGTGNPNTPYEERSRKELYNLARQRDIPGRSSMNKQQLMESLRDHR